MAEDGKIPNPYLAAVKDARRDAKPHAEAFETMLVRAELAMTGGAWVSSSNKAQAFAQGLAEQKQRLQKVHSGVLDAFDEVIAGQEAMVDPQSWQANWHKMRNLR